MTLPLVTVEGCAKNAQKKLTSMDPCTKNNAHLRGSDMVRSV